MGVLADVEVEVLTFLHPLDGGNCGDLSRF